MAARQTTVSAAYVVKPELSPATAKPSMASHEVTVAAQSGFSHGRHALALLYGMKVSSGHA